MTTKTLRRLLREFMRAAFDKQLIGKWEDEGYFQALKTSMTGVDLNEHIDEILRICVHRDVSERAKRQVFFPDKTGTIQLDLFTEDLARQVVIRLGDGLRVKMYEATGLDFMGHLFEQQKAVMRTATRTDLTRQFLQTSVGKLLLEEPALTLPDAMRQFEYWPEPDDEPAPLAPHDSAA